jgi:mannan endo-1,4-beta-mannosidase
MTLELCNEPQTVSYAPTGDPMLSWADATPKFVKAHAPEQLVTTGFESKQGEEWFKAIAKGVVVCTSIRAREVR